MERYAAILFLIMVLVSFGLPSNSMTVYEFKKEYGVDNDSPLFLNEKYVLTADDGRTIIFRKLNDHYDDKVRMQIKYTGQLPQNESFYFVLCENETHILHFFDEERNYWNKRKNDLKLNKKAEFKNTTLYELDFIVNNELNGNIALWEDKQNDMYCGSSSWVSLNYIDYFDEDFYSFLRDLYIYQVYNELKEGDESQDKHILFSPSYFMNKVLNPISFYDVDIGKDIEENIEKLKVRNGAIRLARTGNQSILERFTLPINFLITLSEVMKSEGDITSLKKNLSYDADSPSSLPQTEEELEIYKNLVQECYKGTVFDTKMFDYYGTIVTFAIVSEGLKATSAGPDKAFGTDDDITFIRTYESVGMEPLK